jgi:hypothetical protein
MRAPAISFLFLALSLPALAHHDRDDFRRCRPWHPRPIEVEEYRSRWERARTAYWQAHPRVILREGRPWCEPERDVVFLPPPPPVIVRPRVRLWIGF